MSTTPSQTVGPYFSIGLHWDDGPDVVSAAEERITIGGVVLDGARAPVPDALVETWQADPHGRFDGHDRAFRGFGRSATDHDGAWRVRTLKPGRLPSGDGGWQAPHINVSVFARGLLHRVVTRVYFGDEESANASDPLLRSLAVDRVPTLVAQVQSERQYRFDIHLQGPCETVFFAI